MPDETIPAPAMALREYQAHARDAVRERYRAGHRSALVILPTGTGKTYTALAMISATVRAGGRVLWLAHRAELIEQPIRTWRTLPALADSGRAGIVKADADEADAALVCASVQTVCRAERLDRILAHGIPRVVVVDEAHHATAGQWAGTLERIDAAATVAGVRVPWLLGLTATPERADRASLRAIWGDEPAFVYTYEDAILDGYLCPPRFVVDRLELDDETEDLIRKANQQGDDAEVARLLLLHGVVDHTEQAMRRAVGRRCLVFTASVEQAELTRARLAKEGWNAEVVSASTPDDVRAGVLRGFERGEVSAICNCAVLTEGTDLPSCDCIVAARPFSSKPLWVQAVGRGLRIYPGKEDCLVVDLAGASQEHTMVMAAAMLEDPAKCRKPFIGRVVRNVGDLRVGTRVKVEPTDDGGWKVVALVVGETDAEVGIDAVAVDVPSDVARESTEQQQSAQIANFWKERRRVLAEWTDLDHGAAWACDCGKHGTVFLIEIEPGGWMSYLMPKQARKPRALGRSPCSQEFARALGDDLFRQAVGLVSRGAAWRDRPPSEAQIGYAARLGIAPGRMDAGQIAQAITRAKGKATFSRIGIEGFRAAIGGAA